MRNFRLLTADEIECRAQQIRENGIILLLYKTARTDAALLDETLGMFNWQVKYEVIDGTLYCNLGIREKGSTEWVWKTNCGVESNMEAEKGRASDALKRAGFLVGLGTELYSAPFIFIPSSKCNIMKKGDKFYCNDEFEVTKVGYDEAERINELEISVKGQVVWKLTPPARPAREDAPICERCGKKIVPYTDPNGKTVSVQRICANSVNRFKQILCVDCIKEINESHDS